MINALRSGDPLWQIRPIEQRGLHRNPELDAIIWRVNQIVARARVPLGSLRRRMAKQQLNLFQFATGRTAHLRAAAAKLLCGIRAVRAVLRRKPSLSHLPPTFL
jgi:hypothetical protein